MTLKIMNPDRKKPKLTRQQRAELMEQVAVSLVHARDSQGRPIHTTPLVQDMLTRYTQCEELIAEHP